MNPLSTPSLSPAHTQGHTRCAVVDNSYQQWPQSTQAEQYLLIYRPFLFNALSLHTHSHLNMNVLVSVGETFMWCLFCSSVTIWRWRHTFKRGVWQKTHFSLLCGCSSGAELWPCDVTTCPIFPSPLWLSWKGDKGSELPVYYIAKKKTKDTELCFKSPHTYRIHILLCFNVKGILYTVQKAKKLFTRAGSESFKCLCLPLLSDIVLLYDDSDDDFWHTVFCVFQEVALVKKAKSWAQREISSWGWNARWPTEDAPSTSSQPAGR